jgi:hypothetical protein
MNTESNGLSEQTITRVQTVRREPLTPYDGRYAELIDNTVGRGEIEKLWQSKWYDPILIATADIARATKITLGAMPYLFNIIQGAIVKNWKTTVAGIVGGLAFIINSIFGLQIPSDAILATTIFVIGLFAKDGDEQTN